MDLIPPVVALFAVAVLALYGAAPAVVLCALALIDLSIAVLAHVAGPPIADWYPIPDYGGLSPLYAFLIRWTSLWLSGAVWVVLAVLAALHWPIAGPIGRRIMRLSVAGLLLSQTASPIMKFVTIRERVANPFAVLTASELANPFFVMIGVVALSIFVVTFLVAPFLAGNPSHASSR